MTVKFDVDELCELVRLHANAQGLKAANVDKVLARMTGQSTGPGSWGYEWRQRANSATDLKERIRYANLGSFPFVDGEERAACAHLGSQTFELWAAQQGAIRHTLCSGGGVATIWASGPVLKSRPVLLLIGGIVSLKEQWGQLLPLAKRLGVVIAVTEMPGVGENSLDYETQCRTFVSSILDEIGLAAGGDARLLALSFSFTLALHAAVEDSRIRAIGTVGGPVRLFFDDPLVWKNVPNTTSQTWANILGTSACEAINRLRQNAVATDVLRHIKVPISYVASLHDEIVPVDEALWLRALAPTVKVLLHDDVHGSPLHLRSTRAWLMASLLAAPGPGVSPLRSRVANLGARIVHMLAGGSSGDKLATAHRGL